MRGKFLIGAASAALLFGLGSGAAAQSASDQAGDASSEARVRVGQALDAELSPAGDRDWFRLSVEPGSRYQITLDATGEGEAAIDTVLGLYNANGEVIAENDDRGDGTLNSMLKHTPAAAGDVFIEARAFSPEAVGSYRLLVEAGPVPPDDAGNDHTTRARIAAGAPVTGALESEGDVDWYRFNARVGQRYVMRLSGADGSSEPLGDPLLRVIARDGTELAQNDDGPEGLNSQLEFIPERSGEVFLEASAFGGAATGAYMLSTTAERAPSDNVSGDRYTHGRLALGGSRNDAISFAGDKDWWRIRLEAGQTYRFTMRADAAAASPIGDAYLTLYNADGEQLASDDDGGEGFDSYLEFTAPTNGNYFVEARSFAEDATGGYVISAAAGDIPADNTTDAPLAAEGDYREASIAPAGDRDWFRINLTEGQGLRVAVNSLQGGGELADPYVVLYGPDGGEVARDDDGGDGLNAWFEYVAATGGAHYLEVRSFNEEGGEGRYAVQLTAGEVGASAESAEFISAAGEGRASTVSPGGDADWYAVDLVEGRPYRFYLDATDGQLDPFITLYDFKGEQVASDDDGGAGTSAFLNYVSVTGGTYYLAASAYNNETTGAYSLRVTDTDVPGSTATDEMLTPGDDRTGRIEIPGDLDAYRVELEAGVTYTIEVSGEGDSPLADPFLAILNSNGDRVTSDDDSGDGLDARIRFTPETADMYYVQASGLGGTTGWYKVSVTRN